MAPDAETEALLTTWQREVVEGMTAWCDAQDIAWERQLVRTFGRVAAETLTVQLIIDDVTLVVAADGVMMTTVLGAREWSACDNADGVIAHVTAALDGA